MAKVMTFSKARQKEPEASQLLVLTVAFLISISNILTHWVQSWALASDKCVFDNPLSKLLVAVDLVQVTEAPVSSSVIIK